jgi:3'-5' exoribonuclease
MPAKNQFISKLREDQQVNDIFIVRQKQISTGRTGRNYLRISLGDKTGTMEARVWEGAEEIGARFNQGDPVYITGLVTAYQGILQIKAQYVERLDASDAAKIDWSDYLPSAERPAAEMLAELFAILDTLRDPDIARLVGAFRSDKAFVEAFSFSPAAKAMHHAYVGGLLEHTLGCVRLADRLAPLYRVNRELLVTGAFLHDVGKIRELDARTGFDYTDEGKLLGHILMGVLMLREKAAALPGFPEEKLLHLEHLILSHHGELEWGSPKRPKTVEALALHAIDNIDAKLAAADRSISLEEANEGNWTSYQKIFDRPLYKLSLPEAAPMATAPTTAPTADIADAPREKVAEGQNPPAESEAPQDAATKTKAEGGSGTPLGF